MSPTLIGCTKVMAVIATVATRPLATRAASEPPATSIWESTQPPKISPLPFMSAGCGTVLMIGSRRLSGINSPQEDCRPGPLGHAERSEASHGDYERQARRN